MQSQITGIMIQYYKACPRELWFFTHHLDADQHDSNIRLGRYLHETTYPRTRHEIQLGPIVIDTITSGDRPLILEIKKSSHLVEPAKYQLLYYLYYLKKATGKTYEGLLAFPKERTRQKIILTPALEHEIDEMLDAIPLIIAQSTPPKPTKKAYCRKCAYRELCQI